MLNECVLHIFSFRNGLVWSVKFGFKIKTKTVFVLMEQYSFIICNDNLYCIYFVTLSNKDIVGLANHLFSNCLALDLLSHFEYFKTNLSHIEFILGITISDVVWVLQSVPLLQERLQLFTARHYLVNCMGFTSRHIHYSKPIYTYSLWIQ